MCHAAILEWVGQYDWVYFQVEAADVGDRGVIAVQVPGTDAGCWICQKQTWTTGEQRAHLHIHHKTILYIDIWASSPGGKVRVGVVCVCVSVRG